MSQWCDLHVDVHVLDCFLGRLLAALCVGFSVLLILDMGEMIGLGLNEISQIKSVQSLMLFWPRCTYLGFFSYL
jgi:hypothetical protein